MEVWNNLNTLDKTIKLNAIVARMKANLKTIFDWFSQGV